MKCVMFNVVAHRACCVLKGYRKDGAIRVFSAKHTSVSLRTE